MQTNTTVPVEAYLRKGLWRWC